jgi:hypothetical protein
MAPRLGAKYPIEIEMTSKPRAHYKTPEYMELDLPAAPAIMAGDKVVAEGSDVNEHELEGVICRQLGLPEPEPGKDGILGRLFRK